MRYIILFNKPYNVLTQFRPDGDNRVLGEFIQDRDARVAGRLDKDSEGLLLLTNDGRLNQQLAHPSNEKEKVYHVQVEGIPDDSAIEQLRNGILLNDGFTLPATVRRIDDPGYWPRNPPIRQRQHIPVSWLEIVLSEGRNRQVRRMTAAVGHPTLRLVRSQVGPYQLGELQPGQSRKIMLK